LAWFSRRSEGCRQEPQIFRKNGACFARHHRGRRRPRQCEPLIKNKKYARSHPESSIIVLEGGSSACSVGSLTLRGDFIEKGPTPEERAKTRIAFAISSFRDGRRPSLSCQAQSPGPNPSFRVGGPGMSAGARRCGAAFNRALRESGSNRLFG